jgi:ribose transport system permease protein
MTMQTANRKRWVALEFSFNQERVIILIAIGLFVFFSFYLERFLEIRNLLSLVQSVSVLGILAIGMAVVIISRGLDLTMVAVMLMSVGWVFTLFGSGASLARSLLSGLSFALGIGAINGVLIAYLEIPAIFATLAMGTFVFGFGLYALVDRSVTYVPEGIGWLGALGSGQILLVPMPIIIFALCACAAFVLLRYTKIGRFIYGMGDNPFGARICGIPLRPMTVLIYMFSAGVAFAAGIVMATTVSCVNTQLATTTMVYDIILVVVIGGIGLSGGKGNVRNVIAGTLLIGILLNGMTMMDISYSVQNIVKSLVLLGAIILDSILNPRDEQTGQQGDI